MSGKKYRRKKILVDKKFQLGISLKIILCLACYLVLFCLMAVFSPFLVLVSATASEAAVQQASTEVLVFVRNLLLPLGLTFTCLALHCILLSHKIAGPAFRFKRTFKAVRDGDLSIDIYLRKGDYLMDVAASYNDMIGALRVDVAGVQSTADALREEIEQARAAGPEDRGKLVERAADRAEEICGLLGRYRVSTEEAEEDLAEEPGDEAEEAVAQASA